MDYKKDMRQLIDIVKKASLDAPLENTLEDLVTLTSASKELADRIEMRVRKKLQSSDKDKGKAVSSKKVASKGKAMRSIKPVAIPKPKQQAQSSNALPTSNKPTSSAISQADYNTAADNFRTQQQRLQPISPQPPISPN